MIDDDNNNKMFTSEINKYYIRGCSKLTHVKILDKFRDINKSHKINAIGTTDNYYKSDKYFTIKHCTILLIDDNDHSKMFISKKNYTLLVKIVIILVLMSVIINLIIMNFLMKIMIIMIIMIIIMMMMIMIAMMMIMIVCIIESLLIVLNV